MKNTLLICTLIAAFASEKSRSQNSVTLSKIEHSKVILPETDEHLNFTFMFGFEEKSTRHEFLVRNKETGISIYIDFMRFEKIKSGKEIFEITATQDVKWIEGSFSKKKIGEKSWFSICHNPEESFLFIMDGNMGITVSVTTIIVKDILGRRVENNINPADIRLAENIVIKMLDRMTVLGLTSRPKESAPEWAKRQVAERIAKQKP